MPPLSAFMIASHIHLPDRTPLFMSLGSSLSVHNNIKLLPSLLSSTLFKRFYITTFKPTPSMTPEERLKGLGYDINTIPLSQPKGSYVSAVKTGTLLHLAGHLPYNPKTGEAVVGKVGDKYTADEAKIFAQWAAIRMLKTIHKELGELSKIKRVVKINGYVNCTDDFIDHPKVMNGASDFLALVLGQEVGLHARTAIGCISLPFNVPVEMDIVVEISS